MRERLVGAALAAVIAAGGAAVRSAEDPVPDARLFFDAARDQRQARAALDAIAASWRDGYAALILDLARFFPPVRRPTASVDVPEIASDGDSRGRTNPALESALPSATPFNPGSLVRRRLMRFLEQQTGRRHGDDLRAWRRWLWNRPYEPHPEYLLFKAMLYRQVDPRMAAFFTPGARALIRLDEIDWGGVKVNGIPPLDRPKTIPASAAGWLKDKHVVFGIALGERLAPTPSASWPGTSWPVTVWAAST